MHSDIDIHQTAHAVRVITATSLFDGHDAAINIIRRMLQDSGAEVIHLGHNRSVEDLVKAAIEEDVQGIALSSYQGGHMEYFSFLRAMLNEKNASHIRIFGGGGGVIVPAEIRELEALGVTKLFSPHDGARMGLQGMINYMLLHMDFRTVDPDHLDIESLGRDNFQAAARFISAAETLHGTGDGAVETLRRALEDHRSPNRVPVIGVTGTGGAGKSSLTDEILLRYVHDNPEHSVGVLCCDPSRRKTGGALLGDRIRMNAVDASRVFLRSMAIRRSDVELPEALPEAVAILKAAGMDLIIIETAGIGQGSSGISDLVDLSLYVMTAEYGAATQLEKIDMLDYADIVVINKFDKQGSDDALRDIRKQVQRNRKAFECDLHEMPVFGTIAARFNDDGVTALYRFLLDMIHHKTGVRLQSQFSAEPVRSSSSKTIVVPPERMRYLAEIADTVRSYHRSTGEQARVVRRVHALKEAAEALSDESGEPGGDALRATLEREIERAGSALTQETERIIDEFRELREAYEKDAFRYRVRDREIQVSLTSETLSGLQLPKIVLPGYRDPGDLYEWMRCENVPGRFPFTAGVFPLKRADEEPTRMFAGEGDPGRTNRRFKLLSGTYPAKRLSTAFDSVTLYGFDPDRRPDIYGKVGTSGVSICNLDDVKMLYDGFDLAAPTTSVSMTINGPAPIMLAMFFNAAIDQQQEAFEREHRRSATAEEADAIKKAVLHRIRGTIQADILKEDQGQNTCIFSTDFALKMMGDVQQYFIDNRVENFYSVSISGYHIAEAGANPVTQLAFTLANGFTYVEYYLSRGMPLDSFAPNLSFFFSSGMDPEYSVISRVARRIWAVAMKERYGADERSSMLKCHIQTSGRSLHSRDIQFNDIRTTLQALYALYDNCNSLHTNAYDEAVTTPSAESVRRSLAIQLILNREFGMMKNENPNQGSFLIERLTDLVEEAVLEEFERITARGGVQGAMERGYQRSRIQEESLHYETLKHSGELPVIGVNTFVNDEDDPEAAVSGLELSRATEEEKASQLRRLADFKERNRDAAPDALKSLKERVLSGENIFEELMRTVRVCSLGQITEALYEVGGKYRRNM